MPLSLGLVFTSSCQITEIRPNQAAEKAQLKVDDIITKIQHLNVSNKQDVLAAIRGILPGDKIPFEVKRNGTIITANLIVEAKNVQQEQINQIRHAANLPVY